MFSRGSTSPLIVTNIYCFLLSIPTICLYTRKGDYSEYRPGGEAFQIIGIFSNCSRSSREEFRSADVCKKSIEWVATNREFIGNATKLYHREILKSGYFDDRYRRDWSLNDIDYISFDVCTHEDATRLALDIMLGRQFYVTDKYQKFPRWRNNNLADWWMWTQKILAVMMHTNSNTTDILLHVLYTATFPIHHLDSKWLSSIRYLRQFPKKVFQAGEIYREKAYLDKIEFLLTRKNVEKMSFILVGPQDLWYDHIVKAFTTAKRYCIISTQIDITHNETVTSLLRDLENDSSMKYIFLFGRPEDQARFLNHATEMKVNDKTWILKDAEFAYRELREFPKSTTVLAMLNLHNIDLDFIQTMKPTRVIDEYVSESLAKTTAENLDLNDIETLRVCSRQMERMIVGFMKSFDRKEFYPDNLRQYIRRFKLYGYTVSRHKSLNQIAFKSGKGQFEIYRTQKFLLIKNNILCSKPVCPVGRHNVYNHHHASAVDGNWHNYSWYCDRCKQNWFKNSVSESDVCQPCPTHMFSVADRGGCYDPYILTYNNVERRTVQICFALSVLGCVSAPVVLSVFFLHRDTPLVRSCDFRIVTPHLLLLIISFLSYPALFCQLPSAHVCVTRHFFVCFLNCACTSIVFMKSNRVLMIIQSQFRVRRKDMNRLMFWHLATGFLFSAIGTFIAYLYIIQTHSKVSTQLDLLRMTRDISCTDGAQVNIQIYYHLVLQVLPAVQAYRGRNLPGPFNEAMVVVYTTFITVITYVTMAPIYHFQYVESDKATVQCFTLILTNLVQLALFYWKKVFIIVFQPHKNTREHIRLQIQGKTLVELTDR